MPDGSFVRQDIRVDEGIISALGTVNREGVQVIDATGKWVIRGLIDAHVHLLLSMDSPREEKAEQRLIKAVRNAKQHLHAGVTTVRDCGAMAKLNLEVSRAVERGVFLGPSIVACGEFIAMTGGHVHYWAREADGPDEVRKAAREQIKAGARLVKLMASGGAADLDESPRASQLDEDEMRAAVHEARKAGVPVVVYAHGDQAILAALRAGVNSLEHGTYLTRAVVDALLEKDAAVVPTFAVYKTISEDRRLPKEQRDIARRVYEVKGPLFLDAVKSGIRYGVGTDQGSYYPAGALCDEIACMIEVGLPPRDVLLAATLQNARILGIERTHGSIECGKQADLVILDSNPLTEPMALKQVRLVMKEGTTICPSDWRASI